jgi:methionyl-tRNA formyltransferase
MRVLFAGSPQLAVPSLEAVHRGQRIAAVLTNPDRPAGRRGAPVPTPVKARAVELGLPVLQPERLGDEAFLGEVQKLECELLVVAAFGRIFPKQFLQLLPLGGVNVHPSLLPRHRGPSPIPAAIMAGDPETGVTVQKLAARMDSGDILRVRRLPLSGKETTGSLSITLGNVGAELLAETLELLEWGAPPGLPQEESQATYCRIVRKQDGRIDWQEEPVHIERMIRAYDPWPGAFTSFHGMTLHLLGGGVYPQKEPLPSVPPGLVLGSDTRYGILVRAGQGVLFVTRLQLQARKPMDWRPFLNGRKDFVGARLGVNDD